MSLFGSSPPDAATKSKSSLFDDDRKQSAKAGSGLFDDDTADGESPWGIPTPKKGGRETLVRSLLPADDVPEQYIDAFDVLSNSEYRASNGQIAFNGVRNLLNSTKLAAEQQRHILKQVVGDIEPAALGRNEFNVLLALIGLSFEGEDATLDAVDERRRSESRSRSLPEPLPNPSDRVADSLPPIHLPVEERKGLRKFG